MPLSPRQDASSEHASKFEQASDYSAFIAYAKADKAIARAIVDNLEERALKCWIAPRDAKPGRPFGEEIIGGIERSRCFILILSRAANASNFVSKEVERAVAVGRPICTVRVEDVEPSRKLVLFISETHWIDAWEAVSFETYAEALAEWLFDEECVGVARLSRGPASKIGKERVDPKRKTKRTKPTEPSRAFPGPRRNRTAPAKAKSAVKEHTDQPVGDARTEHGPIAKDTARDAPALLDKPPKAEAQRDAVAEREQEKLAASNAVKVRTDAADGTHTLEVPPSELSKARERETPKPRPLLTLRAISFGLSGTLVVIAGGAWLAFHDGNKDSVSVSPSVIKEAAGIQNADQSLAEPQGVEQPVVAGGHEQSQITSLGTANELRPEAERGSGAAGHGRFSRGASSSFIVRGK